MTEGFYTHPLRSLVLHIRNNSLGTYETYNVSRDGLQRVGYFYFSKQSTLLMPFDHYPSLEELQQLPELFI